MKERSIVMLNLFQHLYLETLKQACAEPGRSVQGDNYGAHTSSLKPHNF